MEQGAPARPVDRVLGKVRRPKRRAGKHGIRNLMDLARHMLGVTGLVSSQRNDQVAADTRRNLPLNLPEVGCLRGR